MSNKKIKKQMIKIFGKECFIDKLKLRNDSPRHYTSKGQKKKMKQLTYHHIVEKSKRWQGYNRKWCFTIFRKSRVV